MGTVVVALERGFAGDQVRVRVDDAVVLDATNVTTDAGSGLAGSVAVDCGPRCRVEIALPDLGIGQTREFDVGELTYLRVSPAGDSLRLSLAEEGPRYI
ncbi:MAG: hypothetical protein ACRDT6_23555 [Micromonosporaceae bacterium]